MKKYEYVSLNVGIDLGANSEEHRTIIDLYASKGWRYVGFIPTRISDYGRFNAIDLVFEKDTEE